MDATRLPTPNDPGAALVWENYVVAQAVQASLGLVPQHALAVGVEVEGTTVRLRFQLSELTHEDKLDIEDIVSELEALVGNDAQVTTAHEITADRHISPSDGVRWMFLART